MKLFGVLFGIKIYANNNFDNLLKIIFLFFNPHIFLPLNNLQFLTDAAKK